MFCGRKSSKFKVTDGLFAWLLNIAWKDSFAPLVRTVYVPRPFSVSIKCLFRLFSICLLFLHIIYSPTQTQTRPSSPHHGFTFSPFSTKLLGPRSQHTIFENPGWCSCPTYSIYRYHQVSNSSFLKIITRALDR
jgi:hypothetical protein